MPFSPLLLITLLTAIIFLLIGFNVLLKNRWLLGWLLGCLGIASLIIGSLALLFSIDILNFEPVTANKALATISFKEIRTHEFDVKYTDNRGEEQSFIVYGDLIQIKGHLLSTPKSLNKYGIKDVVRFDDASSRYISLLDEQNKPNTVFLLPFRFNNYGFDIAKVLEDWLLSNRYFNIKTVDTPFHEMSDGGIYLITIDQQKSLQFVPFK